MNKNFFRKSSLLVLFSCISLGIYAFDWPQAETLSDNFFSYFGQLRGGTVANSLIFKENSEVKACDDGNIIAVILEHDNDFGWFESTLGNAVILYHKNELATVYANLDSETLAPELETTSEVSTGTVFGVSGNSGWQESQSCLEFQVFDSKNSTSVNPRVLMPRTGDELPVSIGELTVVNRDEKIISLSKVKSIPAGSYSLYHTRQEVAVPFKTSVLINGVVMENLSYDTLKENNGKLCVFGNDFYPIEMLYPDEGRQLLSKLYFTSGKNILTVNISDILGNVKTYSYTIDVK